MHIMFVIHEYIVVKLLELGYKVCKFHSIILFSFTPSKSIVMLLVGTFVKFGLKDVHQVKLVISYTVLDSSLMVLFQ